MSQPPLHTVTGSAGYTGRCIADESQRAGKEKRHTRLPSRSSGAGGASRRREMSRHPKPTEGPGNDDDR